MSHQKVTAAVDAAVAIGCWWWRGRRCASWWLVTSKS